MYSYKKMRKRLAVTTAGLAFAFGVSVQAAEPQQNMIQTDHGMAETFCQDEAVELNSLTAVMEQQSDPLNTEETIEIKARQLEEEAFRERQEQLKREQEEAEKQKVTLTAEEQALLASIIFCEAGNQPYEGQVAVGAVIMNRVKSGSYPNSVAEVIYQSGQFGPAMTGWLDTVLASGSYTPAAMQAAVDAASGINPIGECLYFGNGDYGILIGDHYFH